MVMKCRLEYKKKILQQFIGNMYRQCPLITQVFVQRMYSQNCYNNNYFVLSFIALNMQKDNIFIDFRKRRAKSLCSPLFNITISLSLDK